MPEPRAHICLFIPELKVEAHLDLCFEDEPADILAECATAFSAMIEPLREQIAGGEATSGVVSIN